MSETVNEQQDERTYDGERIIEELGDCAGVQVQENDTCQTVGQSNPLAQKIAEAQQDDDGVPNTVIITAEEIDQHDPITDRLARNIGKQILADEINEALSQNGLSATVTVEELSCSASAEIRRRQKANAKKRAQRKRRNKRK